MAPFTHKDYDALERAIIDGRRVAIYRRGTEYVVTPRSLTLRAGREVIEAVHPTTGEAMTFFLDELDSLQVIR
ncbi:MAG TPA: hypothetical protein VJ596_07995 [Gemmatimonadaceae bacterium]|nr:hypothetical protein [Gemmatimonadaceae bacterium]